MFVEPANHKGRDGSIAAAAAAALLLAQAQEEEIEEMEKFEKQQQELALAQKELPKKRISRGPLSKAEV